MRVEIVLTVMFVWWEVTISMRVEWRCASMTSGGQYVMTAGTALMLMWSVISWDIHTLEVSICTISYKSRHINLCIVPLCVDGRAYSNAHFGAGSGPIFLDDVECTSSSSQLLECPSRPILSHNCNHFYDAGVGCEGNV